MIVWILSKQDWVGMFNGQDYRFKAGVPAPVEEEAAKHLLDTRYDILCKTEAPGEPRWAPASEQALQAICPVCDKDFSGADNPEFSLKQHIGAAHRTDKAEKTEEKLEDKAEKVEEKAERKEEKAEVKDKKEWKKELKKEEK